MRKALSAAVFGVVGLAAWLPAPPARAGWLGDLFGVGSTTTTAQPAKANPRERSWVVREFSTVRLAPREAGSQANQHPADINPEALRQQLNQVRFTQGGATLPLFTPDEVAELVEPLTQAFGNAGPDDDVLLLSSARRGDAVMFQPVALTARLFVQGGSLQMIVNDARFEFYNNYVGSRKQPEFTYGSRTTPGKAVLRSESARTVRTDWLAIPLTAAATPPLGATPALAATPPAAPAPAAAPVLAAPVAPAAAATPSPPSRPRDAAFADDVEQRLTTLKRLRDKGLISEEEYQEKRREVMKLL